MPRQPQAVTPKEKECLDQLTAYPKTTSEIAQDANIDSMPRNTLSNFVKKALQ